MGQDLISYMGACTEIPNLGPMFSQTLDSRPSPGDLELWKKVDELWAAHELGPDQPLSLERADPLLKEIFRQQMAKANLTTEASDDILMQIFAQIDEDGSRDIQRAELVNFLKHADVNLAGVAPVQAQQTFGLHRQKTMTEVREEVKHPEPKISTEDVASGLTAVEKVRNQLPPFNYEPSPPADGKARVFKNK